MPVSQTRHAHPQGPNGIIESVLTELPAQLFRKAVATGLAARDSLGSGLPPIYCGTTQWAFTNRDLALEGTEVGWDHIYIKNQPNLISPDGNIAIVASAGDENVGNYQRSASKRSAGPVTAASSLDNSVVQGILDGFQDPTVRPIVLPRTTISLMYLNDKSMKHCRLELVILGAQKLDENNVWHNRLILEPVPFETDWQFEVGGEYEDVDFDVTPLRESES